MGKKQIAINMVANIVSFLVSTGINFFFTPFLISTVGIDTYSFLPMSTNIVTYFTLISTALNSMSARFIALEIHKGNKERAGEYFTSVLYGNVVLSVVFSFCFTIIVLFLERFLKIPPAQIFDIKILFALTFLAAVITLLGSVFSVATFCKNRLDLDSFVKVLTSLVRIGLLVLLFSILKPNIALVSVASVVIALISLFFHIVFTKKLMPEIEVKPSLFSFSALKKLLSAGVWNSFTQCSSIFMQGMDLLLANLFLSETLAGIISVSKTVPNLLYTAATYMVRAFDPQFMVYYAKGKIEEFKDSLSWAMKIVGFILSVPLAGFIALGHDFTRLWVPGEDTNLIFSLSLITIACSIINIYTLPFFSVFTVTNKIKFPAIASFIVSVGNIITLFVMLNLFPSYGGYIIAATSGVFTLIDVSVFRPIYAGKCINVSPLFFYKGILRSSAASLVLVPVFLGVRFVFKPEGWAGLFACILVCAVIGYIVNYFTCLNKNDKKRFFNFIKTKIVRL